MSDIKQSIKQLIGEEKFTKLRVLLGLEEGAAADAPPADGNKDTLKDGTIVRYEKLEVGYPLIFVTEQGTNPAPDGTHELKSGTKISTVNGLITEIIAEAPDTTDEAPASDEDMTKKLNELMDAITAKMAAIESEIEKQKETNKQMFNLIERIGELPTGEPKKEGQSFSASKDKKQEALQTLVQTLNKIKNQ